MNLHGALSGASAHGLTVIRGSDFTVSNGANLGDPMAHADDVILDDIYNLNPAFRAWPLSLEIAGNLSHFRVAPGSRAGRHGADLHLDCCATFMAPDGAIIEALVLIEVDADVMIADTWLMPLADLRPRTDYALVSLDTDGARARFARLACVSFSRGTRITMADGLQKPVQHLRPGDAVLTRDNGVQIVRWVGQQTTRATGAFAPVVIAPGALNNEGELRLSPNQRLFIYQREDHLRAGQAEVVVKAEHLVNGDTVTRGTGGFVDYYQILFDNHEFIFAEGIATESLTLDIRTGPALPREVQSRLGIVPRRRADAPVPLELPEGMLDSATATDVLRRVSGL